MNLKPAGDNLHSLIAKLHPHQIENLRRLVQAMLLPIETEIPKGRKNFLGSPSQVQAFAAEFGDLLRVHHFFSMEPFTKDKFEYAMVRALNHIGIEAKKSGRGVRGKDLSVGHQGWSLKTQADRNLRQDRIHISKFMELGKGKWEEEADLEGLKELMLEHLQGYDRIFTLRHLNAGTKIAGVYEYELVEIPKSLLQKSRNAPVEMCHESNQRPKPGYCRIRNDGGELLFELYFDGGTERKLQIRNLLKSKCIVHTRWKFTIPAELLG